VRIVLCDYQVIFAEVLAYELAAHGDDVVAVSHDLDETIKVLESADIDVCILDVTFHGKRLLDRLEELRHAAPRTHLVLLTGRVDAALETAARRAGVSGIAGKRQSGSAVRDLLRRVHAGVLPEPPSVVRPHAQRTIAHSDARRLAAFLTCRERQALSVLVCGGDTRAVARSLGIAPATARCHIQSLLTKMGAHSRIEVATTAVRAGIVSPRSGEWLATEH